MRELKQSTAANVMVFMTDSADHVTGKTGLTLIITASKDGAAFSSITPTVTERNNGWYNIALTTSHTDTLNDLALHITATGADASDVLYRVVANIESDTYGIVNNGTYGNAAIETLVDELESRLTATRAGLLDNLDAAISSRLATSGYTAPDNATITAIAGYVDTEIAAMKAILDKFSFTGTDVKATLDSEKVTVSSNEDKTGYSIGAGGIPVGAFASGAITDAAIASDAETAIANTVKALSVDGYTWNQILSITLAVLAGQSSDSGKTFLNPSGSATRVQATVDSNKNRTSITLTPAS